MSIGGIKINPIRRTVRGSAPFVLIYSVKCIGEYLSHYGALKPFTVAYKTETAVEGWKSKVVFAPVRIGV